MRANGEFSPYVAHTNISKGVSSPLGSPGHARAVVPVRACVQCARRVCAHGFKCVSPCVRACCLHACVPVCECVCVRACVCACVRVRAHACVRMCLRRSYRRLCRVQGRRVVYSAVPRYGGREFPPLPVSALLLSTRIPASSECSTSTRIPSAPERHAHADTHPAQRSIDRTHTRTRSHTHAPTLARGRARARAARAGI
jgi:hypothetical protein